MSPERAKCTRKGRIMRSRERDAGGVLGAACLSSERSE